MASPFSSMLIFFKDKGGGYGLPAGDVLGEGLSCLGGSGGDEHRGVDTESRVPPIDCLEAMHPLRYRI